MELRQEMDKLKSELSKKESEVGLYVRDNIRAALAEVPYLAVCAYKQMWEPEILETAITFDKFLANFNNADQPGVDKPARLSFSCSLDLVLNERREW